MLFASTVINYIDRQTFSVLGPFLKQDYHWTNTDYAALWIGFRAAYTIGQTFCGRLMDRVGTRRGLSLTVLWYSLVSILTPLARGFTASARFASCWERENQGIGRVLRKLYLNDFLSVSEVWQRLCSTVVPRSAAPLLPTWFCLSTCDGDAVLRSLFPDFSVSSGSWLGDALIARRKNILASANPSAK
jgi:MFS family permease